MQPDELPVQPDLELLIGHCRELLIRPLGPEERVDVLTELGEALRLRHHLISSGSDLDEAIECFRTVVAMSPEPGFLMNLGNALRDRYLFDPRCRSGDLDAAVQAYEEALAALPVCSPHRPLLAHNLACALRDRHQRDGAAPDLERALELFSEAVESAEPALLPQFLSNYATALDDQSGRSGRLDVLQRAVELHERAVEVAAKGHPQRAASLNNLGNALRNLGRRDRRRETIGRAVDEIREAIRLTPETAVDLPGRWNNLGNALRDRSELPATETGMTDLTEAIEAFRRAMARAEAIGVSLQRDAFRNNLANALRTLHRRNREPGPLQEAVGLYELALAETPEGSIERPERASNLGAALLDRAALAADPLASDDRRRGVDLLRYAMEGFDRSPEAALSSAREWSSWALARELWNEAAEVSLHALKTTERIFERQVDRPTKELWLRESQGLMANAAYALARTGDPQRAVVTLDRGLARLLAEALAAREVRPSEGAAMAFDEIRGLAAETPLVFLAFTPVGGVALLVRAASAEVTPVWLPELRQDSVLDSLLSHFRAYAERREAPDAWLASLEELAGWSWQAAMGPILSHLDGAPRIVLIPSGLLSLIPWHAAWTEGPEGRHWAADRVVFTCAPSARGLAAARRRLQTGKDGPLLAIAAPGREGEPGYQPGLRIDAQIAASSREHSVYLEGEAAGRAEVLAALSSCRVVHFSCHGGVVPESPLESWLQVGGGERIMLGDFLRDPQGPRLNEVDLAVLSACESAISGTSLPDEVISLPTGLLQAGVAGIVASHWAVDDVPTIHLMARFYHEWSRGADPASALSAAQRWLRDTSNGEKLDFILELRASSPRPLEAALDRLKRDLKLRDPDCHDFSRVYDWGGFTYVGA